MNTGAEPVISTVLMLLLGVVFSTLAAYVALDLARRVRVLRTRAGALWLLGAASAPAKGVLSRQLIGIAADPPPFALGYHGLCIVGVWAAALVASHAGLGAVGPHALAGAARPRPWASNGRSCRWSPPSPAPRAAACWRSASSFAAATGRGPRRSAGRRPRPSSSVSAWSPASSSSSVRRGWPTRPSSNADRIASATLVLLASVGSCAILAAGLLFSMLEAPCAGRCAVPRPSSSGAAPATV